jgi:hypothetical protein
MSLNRLGYFTELVLLWNVTSSVIDDRSEQQMPFGQKQSCNYFYGPNTFETITADEITNQFSVLRKGNILF